MKKSDVTLRLETWCVKNTDPKIKTPKMAVVKIAARHSNGRFHGATNYTFQR